MRISLHRQVLPGAQPNAFAAGARGAALLVGIMISLVLASWLPLGWDGQVAAYIMRADRWSAGGPLMLARNPDAWSALMNAGKLSVDNSAALAACRDAAAKLKKEQRCVIVLPAR